MTQFTTARSASQANVNVGLRNYFQFIFTNMAQALGVSTIAAFIVAISPALQKAIFGSPLFFIIAFAPIGLVFYMYAKINTMSYETNRTLFYVYSGLVGLSLSSVLLAYTGASVLRALFITAGTFAAMALYGYKTQKDLSSMGSFAMMGVFGIILASIINIFMKSPGLEFAISVIAVLAFTVLTAFDVQRLKMMYYQTPGINPEVAKKVALMGSLSLYMNFINMFIHILQLIGQNRD